jgi:hypothetical protein
MMIGGGKHQSSSAKKKLQAQLRFGSGLKKTFMTNIVSNMTNTKGSKKITREEWLEDFYDNDCPKEDLLKAFDQTRKEVLEEAIKGLKPSMVNKKGEPQCDLLKTREFLQSLNKNE